MIARLIVIFTACILGTSLASAPALAKKSGKAAQQQSDTPAAADDKGGGDLDSILDQPGGAPPAATNPAKDTPKEAPADPAAATTGKDSTAPGSSPSESEEVTTSAAVGQMDPPPVEGQGIGDKNPTAFQQLVPKADQSMQDPEDRILKGNVKDETTLNPLMKPMLPEMDCMGFAARVGATGTNMLKSSIMGKGNGYLTDGGAWSKQGEYPVITQVFKGDSCERQGIRSGDVIIELNGVNTFRLSMMSIKNVFGCWDANMCNHYTLKRGSQVFRVVTRVTWHNFGSGTSEENLWKSTMKRFAKQY